MSEFVYINKHYGLNVKKGMRVAAYGKPGVITGARGAHLKIVLDGEKKHGLYHPVDGIEYLIRNQGKMSFDEYWNQYGELHANFCNGNIKVFARQIWESAQGNGGEE